MPASKSIKTASLQTLKLPVLHMFKHNITHKLIESSWTVSMKRRNKYTSVCKIFIQATNCHQILYIQPICPAIIRAWFSQQIFHTS